MQPFSPALTTGVQAASRRLITGTQATSQEQPSGFASHVQQHSKTHVTGTSKYSQTYCALMACTATTKLWHKPHLTAIHQHQNDTTKAQQDKTGNWQGGTLPEDTQGIKGSTLLATPLDPSGMGSPNGQPRHVAKHYLHRLYLTYK